MLTSFLRLAAFASAAFILAAQPAFADGEYGVRFLFQQLQDNQSAVFGVPSDYSPYALRTAQEDVYLRLIKSYGKFSGRATAQETAQCCVSNAVGVVNEAYLTTAVNNSAEVSVGKKVASWGIGQGWRPLDVIQREDRLAIEPLDLVGVPMADLEYFWENSGLSILAANRYLTDGPNAAGGASEAGVKYSTLLGGADFQAVAYGWEGRRASVGAGLGDAIGMHLELHGSLNYLPYYQKRANILAGLRNVLQTSQDSFVDVRAENGVQASFGGTYTWENGVSALLEAWHDDAAYTKNEWQDLLALTKSQRDLLAFGVPQEAVYGNIKGNGLFFLQQNPSQDSVMARLSYEGKDFHPEIYAIWTPQDNGIAATAAATYRWRDGVNLFATGRVLGGAADSVYASAPVQWMLFLGVRLEGALK